MAVICFASLKGGVGKTSLSVNIAHAFAKRGCETLLIDTDPLAHATRFFEQTAGRGLVSAAPLAEYLFAQQDLFEAGKVSAARDLDPQSLLVQVRDQLALLPGGEEYRHFSFGRGARAFSRWFSEFLRELTYTYDHIVIDTAPEFNVVTRAVLGASNLVVVPVDSSAMSLHGLEALVSSASHIKGPSWCIARTMVDRRASRVQRLSDAALSKTVAFKTPPPVESEDEESDIYASSGNAAADTSPIFLLNNVIFRTEQQNLLSFMGKTSFEYSAGLELSQAYHSMASELERVMALVEHSDGMEEVADLHSYA